jgi:sulfatase maturation enzyme AslB (radical SAM superfamily)
MPAGEVRRAVLAAVREGRMGDRLWLYATYHCNLRCSYCLTESGPRIRDRRELAPEAMVAAAHDAAGLGFASVGVTGGEVFMLPGAVAVLAELAAALPATVLTNGTLFGPRALDRLGPIAGHDRIALQVSLDSAQAEVNDGMRGPRNFDRVCAAVPALRERGIRVRIATTVDRQPPDDLRRLCELHRSWGVPDDDHVVRPVVRRGRAAVRGIGVVPASGDVMPELTITAEGAFLDPFAPTVRHGRTDADRLVSRETAPMLAAVEAFLDAVAEHPGGDAERSIR